MPHVFHPFADTVARIVLISVLVVPFIAIGVGYWLSASDYATGRTQTPRPACSFQPPASCRRPRARLPLLPRGCRELASCRRTAHPYLHDLPFAALHPDRDAGAGT